MHDWDVVVGLSNFIRWTERNPEFDVDFFTRWMAWRCIAHVDNYSTVLAVDVVVRSVLVLTY